MRLSMLCPKGGGGTPGICGAFGLYCLSHPGEFDSESGSQGGDVCFLCAEEWDEGSARLCTGHLEIEVAWLKP